jgi:hypothetical protein
METPNEIKLADGGLTERHPEWWPSTLDDLEATAWFELLTLAWDPFPPSGTITFYSTKQLAGFLAKKTLNLYHELRYGIERRLIRVAEILLIPEENSERGLRFEKNIDPDTSQLIFDQAIETERLYFVTFPGFCREGFDPSFERLKAYKDALRKGRMFSEHETALEQTESFRFLQERLPIPDSNGHSVYLITDFVPFKSRPYIPTLHFYGSPMIILSLLRKRWDDPFKHTSDHQLIVPDELYVTGKRMREAFSKICALAAQDDAEKKEVGC